MEEDNRSAREIYKNYRGRRRTVGYSRIRQREKNNEGIRYGEIFFMQAVISAVIGLILYIAISGDTEIGSRISAKAEEIFNDNISLEQVKEMGERLISINDKRNDIEIDEEAAEKINKEEKIYTDKIKN